MIRKNFFLILALALGFVGIAVFKTGVGYYVFLFFASISALMFVIQAMLSDFKNIINIFKGHK